MLPLKAIHFKGSNYGKCCNCGLANAAKDFFDTENISEEVWHLYVDNKRYSHGFYDSATYQNDYAVAMKRNFSKTVTIRHIILKPVKANTDGIPK